MNNSRHLSIFDPEEFKNKWIHIIGCGNIGSHTASNLARMGFTKFVLYDFDFVEDANICTQNFSTNDENRPKVNAVESNLLDINPSIETVFVENKITEELDVFTDLEVTIKDDSLCIISGLDSIEARAIVREHLIEDPWLNNLPIIDGRIGKEQVEVHNYASAEEWDTIIPEEQRANVPCTEKYIIYTPTLCASWIAYSVKQLCSRNELPKQMLFDFTTNNFLKLMS